MFADDAICNSQQGHEKVLSITNCQRNANQNHSKISDSACEKGVHEKGTTGITNAGKDVEKEYCCALLLGL